MTFPFGIVKDFRPVFDKKRPDPPLRPARQVRQRRHAASRAAAIADIERIRRHANIGMALGNHIFVDWIDGWHQESGGIGVNVNWIHTKFMLIDPLGTKPVTLTGSANWSEPSVTDNDENVLVIRGDKRVADIYFGEFMRLFAHHRFRESVKRHIEEIGRQRPAGILAAARPLRGPDEVGAGPLQGGLRARHHAALLRGQHHLGRFVPAEASKGPDRWYPAAGAHPARPDRREHRADTARNELPLALFGDAHQQHRRRRRDRGRTAARRLADPRPVPRLAGPPERATCRSCCSA